MCTNDCSSRVISPGALQVFDGSAEPGASEATAVPIARVATVVAITARMQLALFIFDSTRACLSVLEINRSIMAHRLYRLEIRLPAESPTHNNSRFRTGDVHRGDPPMCGTLRWNKGSSGSRPTYAGGPIAEALMRQSAGETSTFELRACDGYVLLVMAARGPRRAGPLSIC